MALLQTGGTATDDLEVPFAARRLTWICGVDGCHLLSLGSQSVHGTTQHTMSLTYIVGIHLSVVQPGWASYVGTAWAHSVCMQHTSARGTGAHSHLRSLLRLFLATITIPSVLSVCLLHIHTKAIAWANNWSFTLAFHIIRLKASKILVTCVIAWGSN